MKCSYCKKNISSGYVKWYSKKLKEESCRFCKHCQDKKQTVKCPHCKEDVDLLSGTVRTLHKIRRERHETSLGKFQEKYPNLNFDFIFNNINYKWTREQIIRVIDCPYEVLQKALWVWGLTMPELKFKIFLSNFDQNAFDKLYNDPTLTIGNIKDIIGIEDYTLRKIIKHFGYPKRNVSKIRIKNIDINLFKELYYKEFLDPSEIVDILGLHKNDFHKVFSAYDIPRRKKMLELKYCVYSKTSPRLEKYEEVRKDETTEPYFLEVKCTYCASWFKPTQIEVEMRLNAIQGLYTLTTENRLYCSSACKRSCPTYRVHGHRLKELETAREVQPQLRQLVFERDNWICQKCGKHKDFLYKNKIPLHCHHIEGIRHNPIESADVDMALTLCKDCHDFVHTLPGCKFIDLQCKNI